MCARNIVWAGVLGLVLGAWSPAQSVSTLNVPSLQNSRALGLFLKLSGDGSKLVVHRNMGGGVEDLVVVPTVGGKEVVVHTNNPYLSYYNVFDVNHDASKFVFAPANGDKVYAIDKIGAKPRLVAQVSPDARPWELTMSKDGAWVAFTASRLIWKGNQGRIHATLYVAALDGSKPYRITPNPISGTSVRFAFSLDGSTIVWVDDATKGPMVADRDGKNGARLPFPKDVKPNAYVFGVYCDATGSTVYYQVNDPDGSKLYSVARKGTGLKRLHASLFGEYEVSRDGTKKRYHRYNGQPNYNSTSWLLKRQGWEKMFDFHDSRYVGCKAWSANGSVLVWREDQSPVNNHTYIWRSSLNFKPPSKARPGAVVNLDIKAAGRGGEVYLVGCAFSTTPPIVVPGPGPVDRIVIPLTNDALFRAVFQLPVIFRDFIGRLDPNGSATASIAIPSAPSLVGVVFFTSYVTLDSAPKIRYVAPELRVQIER